jgi:hypothetical protein
LDHLQDLSHLHCCIPKLLSHNPRGLRKLFYRLFRTSKSKALPFFEVVLDLLYSLNPEGTWLQAMGMDYLLTEVNIFVLLTKWFHERPEIKDWLLKLATAPQPKRVSRVSLAEWFIWPTQVSPVMVIPQKDEPKDESHCSLPPLDPILQPVGMKARTEVENRPMPSSSEFTGPERVVMISLDGPSAPFQYRTISTAKRVKFQEGLEVGKRH